MMGLPSPRSSGNGEGEGNERKRLYWYAVVSCKFLYFL